LTTGQGMRLPESGPARPIPSDPGAFRTARDLAARAEAETRQRQRDWQAASTAWRRDPGLGVYYTFHTGQPWSRTLEDQAGGRRQPHDGTVVGGAWAPGRWPGKQGLEFKRVSDRVILDVPGEFASVTLAAWVRVDGLPNQNNSLMMSDGWEEGELHWQIGEGGKLILAVRGRNMKGGAHYHAFDVFRPERF